MNGASIDRAAVLIVTDDPRGIAGGIAAVLEGAGHAHATLPAVTLPDGEAEIDFALGPNAVVVDGSTSLERARELALRLRRLTESPVLVIVPDETDEAALARLHAAGADHCLIRSTSAQVLLAKVDAIIDGRLGRRGEIRNAPIAGTPLAGRYQVVRKLGRGGMGVVFLVEHAWSGERRALKMLVAGATLKLRAAERFEREIEALGSIDHPNVVSIHDAGKIGPTLYYVMDHLPGGSLHDRIKADGPIGTVTALELVAKLADTVQHLHDRGILHRDLKSENILFDAVGEPILTDFGLVLDTEKERLTRDGFTVGTLRAMSPEQLCEPEAIDERTDVYGLGVLLFEALTGRAPFGDSSSSKGMFEVLNRIVEQDAPSPKAFDPSIPAHAAAVCRRALARAMGDRHPSAAALAEHCRQAIRGIALAARRRRTTLSRPIAADPDLLSAAG